MPELCLPTDHGHQYCTGQTDKTDRRQQHCPAPSGTSLAVCFSRAMSRLVNPIVAASTAMKTRVNRKVVQKVINRSSERMCELEFMRVIQSLPLTPEDDHNERRAARLLATQKEFDDCSKNTQGQDSLDFISTKMIQLSEVAATKKRRGRNAFGRGRWNPSRVY